MLRDVCAVVENCKRKTVTTHDVVFVLKRQGRTLYVRIFRTTSCHAIDKLMRCRGSVTRIADHDYERTASFLDVHQ